LLNLFIPTRNGLELSAHHFEARTHPSPTCISEARFRPKSQIYRVSQDMRNRRVLAT